MKSILIIPLLFLSVVFCQKEYNITHITEQNGVYTKKFSDEIVNGRVFQMYGDMKVSLGKMKNGKKDGKWTLWHDNGQKIEEGIYKDGKQDGLWTYYHKNGNIYGKGNFLSGDGGNVSEVSGIPRNGRDGIWKFYYEEGQKDYEGAYKDGKY